VEKEITAPFGSAAACIETVSSDMHFSHLNYASLRVDYLAQSRK